MSKPKRIYEGGVGPLANSLIDEASKSNGFVLELGVHTGEGSTAMFQEALAEHPDPLHISLDWDVQPNLQRPTAPWWHFIVGDTRAETSYQQVVELAGGRAPGIIFIDTDHNYEQMRAELALWGRLAIDSTVWLFHDVFMYGPRNVEMVRAIAEYADVNNWTYDDLRVDSHGLGRLRRLG